MAIVVPPPHTHLVCLFVGVSIAWWENFVVGHSLVKPCFSANGDVGVGYGDEIAKFGRFVFDTLEIYIDDFEWFVTLSLHCCCGLRDQSVVGGRCADVRRVKRMNCLLR